jgi:charged multivesicular body protein 3
MADLYVTTLLQAMVKVTGSLQKSTEIMKLSNSLVKLPQISQAMREMSMEMTKVRGVSP